MSLPTVAGSELKGLTMSPKEDGHLPEYLELLAQRAATIAIEKHTQTCPIGSLAKEIWGHPGQSGGIKADVAELKRCKETAKGAIGVLAKNWQMIVIAAVIAMNFLNGREISNDDIAKIAQKINIIRTAAGGTAAKIETATADKNGTSNRDK